MKEKTKFYLFTQDDEGRGGITVFNTREEADKEIAELVALVSRGYYAGEQEAWMLIEGVMLVEHIGVEK